jgi:putative NADH-flavin reductase
MVLTVFGATGMIGKQVVKQALAGGHTVKAFGRNVDSLIDEDLRNDKLVAVKGYVFDEDDVADVLKGSDAVISVLGGAFDGLDKTRSLGMKNIVLEMKRAGLKRIVALGNMAILNADEHTLIIDKPGYPEEFKPVGKEHLQAYLYLKDSGLEWTFVCAPNLIDEEAKGHYITNIDYPPSPDQGRITAGDLAGFILKEVRSNEHVKSRVGISN